MRKRFSLAVLLFALPSSGFAQATDVTLQKAKDLYDAAQLEQARTIFSQLVSPTWLLPITPAQKAEAEEYLGASYAVLGKADSASTFFQAMLSYDPFSDLDPSKFGPAEISAFNSAKQSFFSIGIKPILNTIIDPQALNNPGYTFSLITTHRARVTVTLVNQKDTLLASREQLFDGTVDGVKDIPWSGVMRNGKPADSTTYEFRVTGTSQLSANAQPQTVPLPFRVEYIIEPLEDTLPALDPKTQLLPVEYDNTAPWQDLGKGLFLTAAGVALPFALNKADLIGTGSYLTIVPGAIGLASAVTAFLYRFRNRSIQANVAENQKRQARRTAFNQGVVARNDQRKARTQLYITRG